MQRADGAFSINQLTKIWQVSLDKSWAAFYQLVWTQAHWSRVLHLVFRGARILKARFAQF